MNYIMINKPTRSIIYDTTGCFLNTKSTPTSVPSLYKSVSCNTPPIRHHRKGRIIKTTESFHSSEEEIKCTVTKTQVIKNQLRANKGTLVKRPRILGRNNINSHQNCACIDCICRGTNDEKVFNEETRSLHAHDCICVSCLCETYEAKETNLTEHGGECSCVECLYQQKNQISIDSMQHPENCECSSCLTSPDSPTKLTVRLSDQSIENQHDNQLMFEIEKSSVYLETEDPDPKMTKSSGQMAVVINRNSEEIGQILDKIRSACKEADQLKRCNSVEKQENLEKTLGTLQRTFEKLQCQCKNMDIKVNSLKQQLLEKANADDNNCGDKNFCLAQCNNSKTKNDVLDEELIQEDEKEEVDNPYEMEVTEARRITSNSLLLFWTPGKFTQQQIGYEILANGFLKSRVYSSFRTCAVLHDLDFKNNIHISVYAVSIEGRLQPPARALFEVGSRSYTILNQQ